MNGTVVKNQLIFDFASGILGPAKSLFASTYLQLNSKLTFLSFVFLAKVIKKPLFLYGTINA